MCLRVLNIQDGLNTLGVAEVAQGTGRKALDAAFPGLQEMAVCEGEEGLARQVCDQPCPSWAARVKMRPGTQPLAVSFLGLHRHVQCLVSVGVSVCGGCVGMAKLECASVCMAHTCAPCGSVCVPVWWGL